LFSFLFFDTATQGTRTIHNTQRGTQKAWLARIGIWYWCFGIFNLIKEVVAVVAEVFVAKDVAAAAAAAAAAVVAAAAHQKQKAAAVVAAAAHQKQKNRA